METTDEVMTEDRTIMQILWAYRHTEPNLCVHIREQDVEALDQCLEFNKQKPMVSIKKTPAGWTVVLTDEAGNAVTPVENNEQDFAKGEQARKRTRLLETIGELAARVKNQAATGDYSSSEVVELADAALVLAK